MEIIFSNHEKIIVNPGENGFDIAKRINNNGEKPLVYQLNGQLYDLRTPIKESGDFLFITDSHPLALAILHHDTSHLMAQALQSLYPKIKFAIGPAIEEGFYYDFDLDQPLSDGDFGAIEQKMKQLSKENFPIARKEISQEEALQLFKDNTYKVELIKELTGTISIYTQGDFVDLCVGPHMPSTGYVKHFKLLSLAGAYWRGDSKNKQLQRIYGTSFFHPEDLTKHLEILEERKKRDHRKLGKQLDLFMISEYGPGFPFWLDKGLIIRRELENYWYAEHRKAGYQIITTPIMLSKELWEVSGHWFNYRDNMYISEVEDKQFAIKPMNCPGGILVYKNHLHSYKDLPLRVGELGLVHRHEASGALSGLFRVRNFTQDDAHIYCRPDQLQSEIIRLLKLFDKFYAKFGLTYQIHLSTRPLEKYIGDIQTWDRSEKILAAACEKMQIPYILNPGDGAFYGPKLDFKLKDSMGRIWQCGTIQLDMNLPERFDLTYVNEKGGKSRPVMLHRAIYGSLERFIGILIEHYAGAFPSWLAPVQVAVLPVNENYHLKYAKKIVKYFEKNLLRVTLDASQEKLGYRLRQTQVEKIPYTLVIGDKEMAENLVTYRKYGEEKQITVSLLEFKKMLLKEIKNS